MPKPCCICGAGPLALAVWPPGRRCPLETSSRHRKAMWVAPARLLARTCSLRPTVAPRQRRDLCQASKVLWSIDMHARTVIAPLALLVLFAASPAGGSPTEARALAQKAHVDYQLGRFDQAAKAYERAFELDQRPSRLFNIGQCYRQLKNYER